METKSQNPQTGSRNHKTACGKEAKPKPDEKKIEELEIEIKSAEWMMQHYE